MALREVLADLRVRVHGTNQLRAANSQVSSVVSGLSGAARALGPVALAIGATVGVVAHQISELASELTTVGDQWDKSARRLGVSVEALQEWRFAAEHAGVASNSIDRALQRLQRSAFEASRGSRTLAGAFRELGVDLRDSDGNLRGVDVLMREVTGALAGVENATLRAGLASRIFGRQAAELNPLLAEGAEGLEEYRRRLAELGGGWTTDGAQAAAAAADATTDYETGITSIKSQMAVAFLPTLTRMVNTLAEWTGWLANAIRNTSAFRTVMIALGLSAAGLLAVLAPAAGIIAALLSPFVLLALLIDDVIVLFEGGQSAIGAFIDELFGVGTAQAVVEGFTFAWNDLTAAIQRAAEWLGIAREAGPAPLTGAARARANSAGKSESTPDGAESRGRGRRGRGGGGGGAPALVDPREVARREQATFGRISPETLAALRSGTAIPAGGVSGLGSPTAPGPRGAGGGAPTTVNQRLDNRFVITVDGAGDPEAVAAAIRGQADDRLAEEVRRAASGLPRGRRPGR